MRGVVTGADLRLPAGFLLGCAGAAHQVEGGNDNDWTDFERRPGRIRDGSVSGQACDHWHRYRADLADLAALGQNAHRFSVEWSRIEPQPGRLDRTALQHYAAVVDACHELGLEPVVTLHHFTLPRWLSARGGVLAPDARRLFARYAAACVEAFGARVRWWVTLNEPGVLATLGYLTGEWPPGERSLPRAFAALRAQVGMHAAAATVLREAARAAGREVHVSVAHHVRGMRPANPGSVLDRLATAVPDRLFNLWFLQACRDGRLRPPVGRGQRVDGAAGSIDYIGLNYYCDDVMAFDIRSPGRLFARQRPDPVRPATAFGWAIEPDGLRRAVMRLWQEFQLPILVTENGVADDADELRPRFIVEHLAALHAALGEGADVRGYLHWTALDNFEWAEGYGKRFGLFSVDRQTMERRPKPSAAVFARICRGGAIPADLLAAGAAQPAAPTGAADAGGGASDP